MNGWDVKDSLPKAVSQARALRRRMTKAEVLLWVRLQRGAAGGLRFHKQHPIGPYIADFACVRAHLVVELDGDSHGTHTGVEHDRLRTVFLESHGWRVFRISNADIYERMDDVLEAIVQFARS